MPSIYLPYVSIALDAFALIVTLIILAACLEEFSGKRGASKHFLLLQFAVAIALVADMISWIGEGHPSLWVMTAVSNTVACCFSQLAIICFLGYLTESLYVNSRAASFILNVFRVLCAASMGFCIGNSLFGYVFSVNDQGHYIHTDNIALGIVHLLFPVLSFLAVILMAIFAKSSAKINRFAFFVYTLFPLAGLIVDFFIYGISLTYAGFTVSVLFIYTSIYLTKQQQLEAQRNALMLSQINPHFIYNTLSTIAAMCESSPKQAKYLTVDFSQYLRRNIGTLSSEELIPFEQELEHVSCYLKIEKARFGERLNVNYAIHCKDFLVPPLTVQPLVENAVKHGVTKKASGGTVKITTYEQDAYYVIEIIDDGVGFDTEHADLHVGLANVKSRIAATCRGEVSVKSTVGIGTRVTIEIPKKKGKRR
ncbi:MAG: histidine kinase [Clostridia bacterium]|nr:histidine kinase [Clostridia bacterium]